MDFRELALVKIRSLTHDPLNKSFLVKALKENPGLSFKEEHEKRASEIREVILRGTPLSGVALRRELESVASTADRLASSFDRWVLRTREWPSGSYLYYRLIHNPFNPEVKQLLKDVDNASCVRVAAQVNEVLSKLGVARLLDRVPEKEILLYNAIHLLLEATWYANGLSPSLADTRVPTHTIFDHLYATATTANMAVPVQPDGKPRGFLVVVDYPGIQAFVNAGRKTGDLWAGSWILSNVMWGVARYFGLKYGLDVIVSPTPRLNPYMLRSFIAHLLGSLTGDDDLSLEYKILFELGDKGLAGWLGGAGGVFRDGLEELLKIYATVYGVGEEPAGSLFELWLQPIIPATISLILPAELPDKGVLEPGIIADEVLNVYYRSWRTLRDVIAGRFTAGGSGEGGGVLVKLVGRVLAEYSDILDQPPQSPSIAIVDLGRVYEGIVNCLEDPGVLCDELNINRGFAEEVRKEFEKEEAGEVAKFLLWHVALTSWRVLSRSGFGAFYSSIPRPFWYLAESGELKPVSRGVEAHATGWYPCSLCGDEPAVVIAKKEGSSTRLGEVGFSRETLEWVGRLVGGEVAPADLLELEKILKPGEALGPYCFFKRATFLAFKSGLRFVSTDDVALTGLSRIVEGLGRGFADKLIRSTCSKYFEGVDPSDCESALRGLLSPGSGFKDVGVTAEFLGAGYEEFRRRLSEGLRSTCYEVVSGESLVEALAGRVAESLGVSKGVLEQRVEQLVGAVLTRDFENRRAELARRLCNFFSLRDAYAIVRGDADYVGEVFSGRRLAHPMVLLDAVLKHVGEYGEVVGAGEVVLEALRAGYERAARVLGSGAPLTSPSITHSLSLNLMLTAIEDWRRVRGRGVLVFSGGDDVYALTPVEYALGVVLGLRRGFFSEGFKRVNDQPVVPEIPTGRSFSVRVVRLMDSLSEEVLEAARLLEEVSKRSVWKYFVEGSGFRVVKYKDALTVSSSSSGVYVTLPLDPGLGVATSLALAEPFLLATVLSSNVPEDFEGFEVGPVLSNPEAVWRAASHVFGRNLYTGSRVVRGEVAGLFEAVVKDLGRVHVERGGVDSSVVEELVGLITVWRVVV